MHAQKALSLECSKRPKPSSAGVSVLVVDSDPTCLAILSKMLRTFEYEVLTVRQAIDALYIIKEREDELDLVLTEFRMPEIDNYELLEKIETESKLPVAIMSSDNSESAMLGGLSKGAVIYLVKPITVNTVKNLWQYAFRRERYESVDTESLSLMTRTEGKKSKQGQMRRDSKDEEGDRSSSAIQKRPRLIWTKELHSKFLEALRVLGPDKAHPKNILELMNVPGLKKDKVSSHLQKFRSFLKQKSNTLTCDSSGRSFSSSTFNLQGSQKPHPNTNACQLGSRGHIQNNLNSPIRPPFDSTHFLNHESLTSDHKSDFQYDQSILLGSLRNSSYPNTSYAGNMITSYGELVSFGRMENSSREETLSTGQMDASNCPTLLTNSIEEQQSQQFQLPPSPPAPQEHEEHYIFEAEGGEIDELFGTTNSPSQWFSSGDFNDLTLMEYERV